MVRKYSWTESTNLGNAAVDGVKEFLSSRAANTGWYPIKLVESVEDNQNFRKRDIDLLVIARVSGTLKTLSIEVKGDINDHTGNFFLETISDVKRRTPGAFLATTAKWYFYYFLRSKTT
ncbi:MAG: hypothetical protein QY326_02685 [Bdellovibrionota bacterium]|nr:MAG: hypothetical protein QY326_02685 [Bdellovibrionota bacterium]